MDITGRGGVDSFPLFACARVDWDTGVRAVLAILYHHGVYGSSSLIGCLVADTPQS